jgi:hypothetical protein
VNRISLSMTLEDFAAKHNLPPKWIALRHACEGIVRDPQFWSRPDLQSEACKLATQASDMLRLAITVKKDQRHTSAPHPIRR